MHLPKELMHLPKDMCHSKPKADLSTANSLQPTTPSVQIKSFFYTLAFGVQNKQYFGVFLHKVTPYFSFSRTLAL